MSKEKGKYFLYTIFFVIAIFLTANISLANVNEKEYDFHLEPTSSFAGEWEFYWQELYEPEHFLFREIEKSYINVPGAWSEQTINGIKLSSVGYGTYRTTFHIPKEYIERQLALTFHYIGSAYRIWINGDEYPGLGTVGKNKNEEIPQLQRHIIVFVPKQETVELVMQVSNFSFREGGIIFYIYSSSSCYFIPSL